PVPSAPPAPAVAPTPAPAPVESAAPRREEPAAKPTDLSKPEVPARGPAEAAPSPFRAPPAGTRREPDATKPSVDPDTIRRRANEIAREGSGQRAVLPFPMPPVPPKKSKMEEALEKARKPDCRDAYKDLGLAAVVPLIANEFGEGTCRW